MVSDLVVTQGLDEVHRRRAAELLWAAFGPKYGLVLGSRESAVDLLARALRPRLVLQAVARGELVALIGLERGGQRSLVFRWTDAVGIYGLLTGTLRWLSMRFIGISAPAGELALSHLAVAAGWRGQGIGTRLLAEAFAFARAQGYAAVRLGVIDTNPNARRLYERLGFVPASTLRHPLLFRPAGFTAVITMVKRLDHPGEQR